MALYTISDLHLAVSGEKPMDVFGEHWSKHDEKIKENWINNICESDTVLIAGDISWSMNMEEGMKELQWIHELPGKKIITKGNHDFWWNSITKLNSMYEEMHFIQNNFFTYNDYAICGTRGWICPGVDGFNEHDKKIYERELNRLRLSLESGRKSGFSKFIVMLHYPPTNDKFQKSEIMEVLQEYHVEKVIYGHLHGPFQYKIINETIDGIEYYLTSCDFLNFKPLLLLD